MRNSRITSKASASTWRWPRRGASRGVEEDGSKTAIFYTIPLAERSVILISIGAEIHRFSVPVAGAELNATADQLRRDLESFGDRSYLETGNYLRCVG